MLEHIIILNRVGINFALTFFLELHSSYNFTFYSISVLKAELTCWHLAVHKFRKNRN